MRAKAVPCIQIENESVMKKYKYNYTYIISCTDTSKKYYGVRSCDCLPAEDIYLGSSKYLTEDIKKLGKNKFKKRIDKTFDTREDANEYERLYILNNKLHLSENWYNKAVPSFGNEAFSASGENNPMFGKSCRDNMTEAELTAYNHKMSISMLKRYEDSNERIKTGLASEKAWREMSEEKRLNLGQKIRIRQTNQYAVNVNGTINILNGREEAAEFLNCSKSQICKFVGGWVATKRSVFYNISVTIHKCNNSNKKR